jgi:uncharacterized repeat protein (TIGR02543 family)
MKSLRKHRRITRFLKVGKGVSAVIAVLLMIAIAVIAALVAYFWVTGYFTSTSHKVSEEIQIPSVYYTGPNQYLGVYVQNVGQGSVTLIENQCLYVDGVLLGSARFSPEHASCTLQVNNTALIVDQINLTLNQRIKIKVVTSDGTSMENYFTITKFEGQSPYSLSWHADPSGGGSVTPNKTAPYSYGDVVALTESPNVGYTFSSWSGDGTGAGATRNVTVTGIMSVTAHFTRNTYSLSVNTVGQGSISLNNSGPYHYGDMVRLTANAAGGWIFSSWSGDASGSANPTTILIDGNKTVNATFTENQHTLTMYVLGQGTVNPGNGTHTSGATVNIEATAALGWSFQGWSGDASGSANTTITMDNDKTVTATFTQNAYTLTVNVVGQGSVSRNNSGPYYYGDVVGLTANSDLGWTFSAWSGDLTGSASPTTIVIDGDKTVDATFTQIEYTLTINVSPPGSGTVLTNQSVPYHYGDVVELTASGNIGWGFSAWSGDASGSANPTTILIDGDKTVTATFTQIEYTLTVGIIGNGAGSVTKTPNQATYHYGDSVQLNATANVGSYFAGWSGDLSGTTNPDNITIDGDKAVNATFTLIQYHITITASPSGATGGNFSVTYTKSGTTYMNEPHVTGWTEWADANTVVTVSLPQQFVPSVAGAGGIRYNFTGYNPSASVTMTGDEAITLVYQTQYQVNFAVDPTGRGTTNPSPGTSNWYNAGASVSISATDTNATDEYVFCYWNATTTSITFANQSATPTTATVNGPGTITAYFRIPTEIDWYTQPGNVNLGDAESVMGILYDPNNGWLFGGLSGKVVNLVFLAPNGTQITIPLTTHSYIIIFNGIFNYTFVPSSPGNWSAYAQFNGDSTYNASKVGPTVFTVTNMVSITITSSPDTGSGFVTVNGTAHSTPYTNSYAEGTTLILVALDHTQSGTKYNWTSWSDGGLQTHNYIVPSSAQNVTAYFQVQYYLTVTSAYDTPGGQGWYDPGATAYATLTSGSIDQGNGTRRIFTNWSGNASGTNYASSDPIIMNGPKTATANWQTQYRLTVTSAHDSPNPGVGDNWYPSGTPVTASVVSPADESGGTRYRCTGRNGTGSVSSGSGTTVSFTITTASTITWNWIAQYQVTFDQNGLSSDATGTVLTVGTSNYTYGQLPQTSIWVDNGATYSYSSTVSSSTPGKRFILTGVAGPTSPITAPGTIIGSYKIQYRLTVTSAYDSPTPAVGDNWYDNGTSITASVTSPYESSGARYNCTGWSGTGSVPSSGSDTSITFTIDQASTITWNWIATQYQVSARYSTSDGSTPTESVVLSATQSGSPFTLDLTTSAQLAWLDAGTPWSVNNPIPASPTTEQWNATSGTSGFVLASTNINPTYYHQYQVTFQQSGLSSDASGTVLTVGSNTYTYSTFPSSAIWVNNGTTYTYSSTVSASSGKNYVLTGVTGVSSPVHISGTVTGTYKTQYYFTVTSAAGTSGGNASGWYDAGSTMTSSVNSQVNITGPPMINYTSTGYTGTGDAPASGSGTSVSFTLNQPSNLTWHWHGIMTLYPNGSGGSGSTGLNPSGYSNNWQCVSDYSAADNAAYVYAGTGMTGNNTDYYSTQDHGSATGTINNVTAYIRAERYSGTSTCYGYTYLRLGSNYVTGAQWTLPDAWQTRSDALSRPGGGSWSWTDIDNLQCGVRLYRASSTEVRCTLVWTVVDFDT